LQRSPSGDSPQFINVNAIGISRIITRLVHSTYHELSLEIFKKMCKRKLISSELALVIEEKLQETWSPEQIVGRFWQKGSDTTLLKTVVSLPWTAPFPEEKSLLVLPIWRLYMGLKATLPILIHPGNAVPMKMPMYGYVSSFLRGQILHKSERKNGHTLYISSTMDHENVWDGRPLTSPLQRNCRIWLDNSSTYS